jgi:hypothetical protein
MQVLQYTYMEKVLVKNKNMKNLKLILLTIIILFYSNVFAQTPLAFEKLDAFEKNEIASILKDTNNYKNINTVVDTLKSLYKKCDKIYKDESKDIKLRFYLLKVLKYKYMALKHLSKLATYPFFKNKKREFDFLSSKFKDEQNDVTYAKKNSYNNFEDELHSEIRPYNFNTIKIAYLLGDMKKQLSFALAIDSSYISVGRAERSLLSIYIIEGLIKNNNLEGIDKRIDTKVTGYSFKNSSIAFDDKTIILSEFATMLNNNKTSLINIDKTGKLSNDFSKLMFDQRLYVFSYELLTDAANAGYDLPKTKIDALWAALVCWRLNKLDKATVIKNIDTLKEFNKKTAIGNAGWKVIVDTYTFLDDKIAAEESKKNIK